MTTLDNVRDQVAAIEPSGGFATRRTSPAGDLHLQVKGIGRIPFPISRANARRLAAIARPARYGLKDRTRFDRRVRDTGEIAKSLVTIDESRWARTLTPMLELVHRDLGLAAGIRLTAALHNLLVYEPGQFFASHQDSEKADDMFGTLIVILPAEHQGGAIVIEHHDARVTYRGTRRQLTFVAFYADCHHEVRPVTSGHRIVLTYNLMATRMRSTKGTAVSNHRIETLARSIQTYFETPRPPRWSSDSGRGRPDRLVYLLDHQYTRRSLAWHRLKNADAARAAALRAVADRLDCEIALALADVHESWSCEDTYETFSGYGRRGWRWREDEDEEFDETDTEDDAPEPFDVIDLLDSDVELRHWVGSPTQVEGMPGGVDSDEVCFTKASDELEPFASEHEGYMGNYGNTVDRWYHRAAVVLWPRERTFVIRARVAPRWAIDEIRQAIHDQNLDRARSLVERVTPFWSEVAPREEGRGFLERTLQAAADLDSPELARALVQPFTIERVTPRAATKLTACCHRYGFSWCETVLDAWTSDRRGESAQRLAWIASLPDVCRAACADGSTEGLQLARWLVANRWDAAMKRWNSIRDLPNPSSIVDGARDLSGPILGLLQGSVIAIDPQRHAQILRTLVTRETRYPTAGLAHLLRAAYDGVPRNDLRTLGLASVRTYCVEALGALSRQPVRAAGDWAIAASIRCPCRLCGMLGEFLRDPIRRQFEWPLAKDHRAHVHHVVDAHGLPVSHVTRRIGRPFTLVLTKTDAIFQREAAERTQWDRDLNWLTDMASAFEQSDGC
jgi:2OG-Fe(II) oxygenase superfamily